MATDRTTAATRASGIPIRDSGHGGGTTLTALVEQTVDELSFYCWALDITPPSLGVASAAASEDAQSGS